MKAEYENLREELEYPQLVHVASRTARNRFNHLEHCQIKNYLYFTLQSFQTMTAKVLNQGTGTGE
jgi:hypothetical protein